jgi:chemotaxis protein methyltransferase CheR
MTPTDYLFLCDFLKRSSGLSLGPDKGYLITSRLQPLARDLNVTGISEIVTRLRSGTDPQLSVAVTEAMTTNETSFFRDATPFEELRNYMLPRLLETRARYRSLRIWSAACSTGQEPCTLAILLHEMLPDIRSWRIEIVATDIDETVLGRARAGRYSERELQRGMPQEYLNRYFERDGDWYQASETLRSRITWKQLNLLKDFSGLGKFDIIFCRNVLIYFDNEDKIDIVRRIHRQLASDGFLILGAAETVIGLCDDYSRDTNCRSAVYTSALTPAFS